MLVFRHANSYKKIGMVGVQQKKKKQKNHKDMMIVWSSRL